MILKALKRLSRRNLSDIVNAVLFILVFLVLAYGIETGKRMDAERPAPSLDAPSPSIQGNDQP